MGSMRESFRGNLILTFFPREKERRRGALSYKPRTFCDGSRRFSILRRMIPALPRQWEREWETADAVKLEQSFGKAGGFPKN
jgi:hypothetical protein